MNIICFHDSVCPIVSDDDDFMPAAKSTKISSANGEVNGYMSVVCPDGIG